MSHRIRIASFWIMMVIGPAACPHAGAIIIEAGYQATPLYTTAGTFSTIGGLAYHQGKLYFGQTTEIKSLDLATTNSAVVGTIPANTDIAAVTVQPTDGTAYVAYGTSFSSPYPHTMGHLNGGVFIAQLSMDGIYDTAISPSGQLFFTANPDLNHDQAGDGSRVYRYDWTTGTADEVANLGASTGGLAFDSAGNLYCSVYESGQVVQFTASQVSAGGLALNDSVAVLNLASPGMLAFDDQDRLFAGYLDSQWNNHIALYDPATGVKLADIAQGGGKMVWADGTLYTVDTDWAAYASTIEAIHAVPEPASWLLISGVLALAMRRSRRSAFFT